MKTWHKQQMWSKVRTRLFFVQQRRGDRTHQEMELILSALLDLKTKTEVLADAVNQLAIQVEAESRSCSHLYDRQEFQPELRNIRASLSDLIPE